MQDKIKKLIDHYEKKIKYCLDRQSDPYINSKYYEKYEGEIDAYESIIKDLKELLKQNVESNKNSTIPT